MWRIAAFIVVLGALFYFFRNPDTPELNPAPAHPSPRSKKVPAEQTAPIPPPEKNPAVTVTPSPQPEQSTSRPPDSVSFVLRAGYVITHGDILIGEPKSENFPDTGFIKMPKIRLWPQQQPIAFSLHEDLQNVDRVHQAIAYFNAQSPVQFVPLTDQTDSIVFAPVDDPDLCLSYIGRVGGHQPIFLGDRCQTQEVKHEIMHALGFVHEQSRPDRDSYVKINWDRITEDKRDQFEIVPDELAKLQMERPFDYNSIMIYPDTAAAIVNGDLTMQSKTEKKVEPARNGLSNEDLNRLRILLGR